jgi:hypothetical protein
VGKTYAAIDDEMAAWIGQQHVIFVSTAPLAADGLLNCSPKGMDTFRIVDPRTVAYLDLTGSGTETIANLNENGRITIMFCAFEGPPKILRLYGTGTVLAPSHPDFDAMRGLFPDMAGVRSIIRVAVDRIADSCGYAVPRYTYRGERDTLARWIDHQGPAGIAAYQAEHNATSLNGLPALSKS